MTRKDYKLIASAFKETLDAYDNGIQQMTDSPEQVLHVAVYRLCQELKKDNIRFDAHRFIAACGLSEG